MQSPGRDPSMEDILASIKKVIQEEKELRTAVSPLSRAPERPAEDEEPDVLELDQPIAETPAAETPPVETPSAPPADLGPPLLEDEAVASTRQSLDRLGTIAAAVPEGDRMSPLEQVVRDMLRPALKEWMDENLPQIVDEHVKREIGRITGRKL